MKFNPLELLMIVMSMAKKQGFVGYKMTQENKCNKGKFHDILLISIIIESKKQSNLTYE